MIREKTTGNRDTIDAELAAKMFYAAAENLEVNKEWINDLNVFPVPDGDTGTNMCMTIMSAVSEVQALGSPVMKDLAKAIASGSLRGARGNSGVILSQLFRGFSRVMGNYEELDKMVICEACQKACDTAYKAVMKPKEGTILTVARGIADKALELVCNDDYPLEAFLAALIEEGDRVLAITPELLPVLKQAGVVDSGGQGLMEILRGAQNAFLGIDSGKNAGQQVQAPGTGAGSGFVKITRETEEEIKFGYCTEFIIVLNRPLSEEEEYDYRVYLNSMGDSIVLVADDDIVKTHVHTNDPGMVLHRALTYGSLSRIKIDNMREEHQEKLIKDAEKLAAQQAEEQARREREAVAKAQKKAAVEVSGDKKSVSAAFSAEPESVEEKEYGFISVAAGAGIGEVFRSLGVDYMIEGGQTMNPSTEDMLTAISKVNAKNIFIFPNNKNIILAANQAASLVEDRNIIVIPTRTVPQGITAMVNFVPEAGIDNNRETMLEVIDTVKTGQITYAIRDTQLDGLDIKKGDYMGIGDTSLLTSGKEIRTVVIDTVAAMVDEESSFLCLYYGEDMNAEDAEELGRTLADTYPQCEVEIQNGGQPVYYYILSVE